jgi:rapamycin-insensitive companion of mTOR
MDGSKELCMTIIHVLIFLLDNEETRCFLRPNVELDMIISSFTDAYSKTAGHEERLISSSLAIVAMLRTWAGIVYLCVENKTALKSLVDALCLQHQATREVILEMFFEVFLIEMPKWYPDFVSSSSRVMTNYEEISGTAFNQLVRLYAGNRRMNLINQYQSVVFMAFIDVGLVEALMQVIQDPNKNIATRASILVGELREISSELMPQSANVKINSLPTLFQIASDFGTENKRHSATTALARIDSLQHNKERFLLQSLSDSVARYLIISLISGDGWRGR